MPSLPFLTPPAPVSTRQIGNSRCGILELEVRGGLTVFESATIAELLAGEQSSFVKGAQIADAIAKEESITLAEAFQIVESAISARPLEPEADAIRLRQAARIQEVAQVYHHAGQRHMEATVCALVRSRLQMPDWTIEQTRTLDKVLFDGIYLLATDEQAAENMPSVPVDEEELKKPQPVSAKKRPRTGPKSSGS